MEPQRMRLADGGCSKGEAAQNLRCSWGKLTGGIGKSDGAPSIMHCLVLAALVAAVARLGVLELCAGVGVVEPSLSPKARRLIEQARL